MIRRLLRALATGLAAALAAGLPARAGVLYSQDFQKGVAPEWAASGAGDTRLTVYNGNVSMRLAGHARSRTIVATTGERTIVVRAKLAALDLGPEDSCRLEVSPDGGATWLAAVTARRGQDDGVGRVAGAFADPRLDGRASLILRFRADLSRPDAACWGDDVSVTGATSVPWRTGALDLAALSGTRLDGLSPMSAFAPGDAAGPPKARFAGRLTLAPKARPDGFSTLVGDPPRPDDPRLTWPAMSIDLIQDGDRLIPAVRGPIAGANPEWEWLIAPGRAWSDPADGGYTRAVLPVALEERNANCVHNGRALFLFRPDGSVTRAAVQFDADTCAYFQFDAWSLTPASYAPGPVAGADALIARDRAERAGRAPQGSPTELAATWPGLDVEALARAAGPFAVWGLDDGATNYAAPCPTRAGPDPYCAERALPSYSLAKTLVGMQGLLRLEALEPGASQRKVADLVPACARAGGWGDVRLIDLLDMASGHYVSPGPETDEDSAATLAFFDSTTAAEKLAFACGQPRKAPPGKVWVYHTADSFLLGAAMAAATRASSIGDSYDGLIGPLWRAIGQSADLDATRRTYDAAAQPFTGWGLVFTRDDMARAARFLNGVGPVRATDWLDRSLLAEALQRSRPGGGFQALGLPNLRYRHGLWARDIGPLIGCGHPVWTPFLSGYGGISVVLFANGVTFYAVGDQNHFDWAPAAAAVNHIRSMCG